MSELTRARAVQSVRARLAGHGVAAAQEEARWIVLDAAGLVPVDLLSAPDCPLPVDARAKIEAYVARRLTGEPVTRILGTTEFWGLTLHVAPDVLDPRADSEALVRLALRLMPRESVTRLVDLGTGSGALLCALLSEYPDAIGIGVDLSRDACRAAQHNLAACGLSGRALVVQARWLEAVAGPFDLIISNPPYIESAAIAGLESAVRDHDPALALDGGADGLAAYRAIISQCVRALAPAGHLVLELGAGQAEGVAALIAQSGLVMAGQERDFGGHIRALAARHPQ